MSNQFIHAVVHRCLVCHKDFKTKEPNRVVCEACIRKNPNKYPVSTASLMNAQRPPETNRMATSKNEASPNGTYTRMCDGCHDHFMTNDPLATVCGKCWDTFCDSDMPSLPLDEEMESDMAELEPEPEMSWSAPVNPLDVQEGGSHYKHFKIQPVEFIAANDLGFLEGCVIKRMCRHDHKNGVEDLRKAKHEIDLMIQLYYPED